MILQAAAGEWVLIGEKKYWWKQKEVRCSVRSELAPGTGAGSCFLAQVVADLFRDGWECLSWRSVGPELLSCKASNLSFLASHAVLCNTSERYQYPVRWAGTYASWFY